MISDRRSLANFVEALQGRGDLLHVTPIANRQSVLSSGVLCPRRAFTTRTVPGCGSESSNIDAVQLFDYLTLPNSEAVRQLVDFVEREVCFASGATLVVLSAELRRATEFVPHSQVRTEATSQKPAWRYYPFTEVWWRGEVVTPESIVAAEDVAVRNLSRRG